MGNIGKDEYLGKSVELVIEHRLGSKDPALGIIYLANVGSVKEDPDRLAYVLGVYEPLNVFTGDCIAIIRHLDDQTEYLVVVSKNMNYSDAQIRALTEFTERFHRSELLR